jgi:hypothetical protein
MVKAGVQTDISNCETEVQEIRYLGLVIGAKDVSMGPAKVQHIQACETPCTPNDILKFTGFAGFYRRSIRKFSKICAS